MNTVFEPYMFSEYFQDTVFKMLMFTQVLDGYCLGSKNCVPIFFSTQAAKYYIFTFPVYTSKCLFNVLCISARGQRVQQYLIELFLNHKEHIV